MSSISGSFTIAADVASDTRIVGSPYPVVGTVTLDFTSSSFSGNVVLKKRKINSASSATWKACTYQTSDSTTDIAASTPITGDKTAYVRLDGEELSYTANTVAAGSLAVEWAWSAG